MKIYFVINESLNFKIILFKISLKFRLSIEKVEKIEKRMLR